MKGSLSAHAAKLSAPTIGWPYTCPTEASKRGESRCQALHRVIQIGIGMLDERIALRPRGEALGPDDRLAVHMPHRSQQARRKQVPGAPPGNPDRNRDAR